MGAVKRRMQVADMSQYSFGRSTLRDSLKRVTQSLPFFASFFGVNKERRVFLFVIFFAQAKKMTNKKILSAFLKAALRVFKKKIRLMKYGIKVFLLTFFSKIFFFNSL